MKKLAYTLPLAAAVAVLGACAVPDEPQPVAPVVSSSSTPVISGTGAPVVSSTARIPAAPAVVLVPAAVLRAGTGVVDSVNAVPMVTGNASAGSSAGASRLGIKMSDGTMQYVDYNGREITVGQRVELTSDGFIRRI